MNFYGENSCDAFLAALLNIMNNGESIFIFFHTCNLPTKAVVLQRPSRSKWVLERLPDHVRPEQLLISGSGSEPEKAAPSRVWKK
jgi:hypothetical protein